MAQRNELSRLLGRLDSGQARGRENIAFCNTIRRNQIERRRLQFDPSCCDGLPMTERFGRDVDHFRAAVARNVRELLHGQPPIATILRPG